jgi:hypothetical protein
VLVVLVVLVGGVGWCGLDGVGRWGLLVVLGGWVGHCWSQVLVLVDGAVGH